MTLHHSGLAALTRLIWRAQFRRAAAGLRTVKGVLLFLVFLALISFLVVPQIVVGFQRKALDPATVRTVAPVALLAFCALSLLTPARTKGIVFRPAEVDFLFAAPVTRQQLLAYKIGNQAPGGVAAALFTSVFLFPHVTTWWAGFIGAFLALTFINFVQMASFLFASATAERAYTTTRKLALMLIVGAPVAAAGWVLWDLSGQGFLSGLKQFRESWTGVILLAPFEVFGRTIAAERWFPDLALWAAIGLLLDAALLTLIFRLDADYLEASIAATQLRHEQANKIRSGRNAWTTLSTAKPSKRRTAGVPMPPRLGGVGPIAWRQLVEANRSGVGLFIALTIFCSITIAPPLISSSLLSHPYRLVGLFLGFTYFLFPQMINFDFRSDLDRMPWLKSLPASPISIALGEIAAPILIASTLQAIGLLVVALFVKQSLVAASLGLLCIGPMNLMLFGLENLFFLLLPYRLSASGLADIQGFARTMLLAFVKFLASFVMLALALAVGGGAYWLSGESLPVAAGAVWLTTMTIGPAFIPALGWAFGRFDASVDAPP